MRLRKMAAGVIAAAMALASLPQVVSASGFENDINVSTDFEVGDIFFVQIDMNTGNVIGEPQSENDYANDFYYGCKVLTDETIGVTLRHSPSNIKYNITIPDTIAGYTVTQLGYDLTTNEYGGTSVETIFPCFAVLNVPDTVETINLGAFMGNVTIEEINFGENSQLKNIGNNAFQNCRSLKSVTIPAGVETINFLAFGNHQENMAVLPNFDPFYGSYVDKYSLEFVKFAEGSKLTKIEQKAFSDQKNLKFIELPESVKSIDPSAFEGSSLETIYGVKGSYAETFANENGYVFIEGPAPEQPVSPDKTNLFSDEKTGVKVVDTNGALPESAEMSVKYDDRGIYEGTVAYEITFTKDGEACDLTNEVEVWLPVPEEMRRNTNYINAIKVINRHTEFKAEYRDGCLVFKATVLGVFNLVGPDYGIIEGPQPGHDSNTVTDEETGISVSGAVPEGAQLVVTSDTENSTDTRLFLDITLVKDGEECQPEGKVTVKIPVPEEFKDKADTLKVYHFVDGKYEDMNAKLEEGYLVFETDHFSIYVVTPDVIPEDGDDTTTTENTPATEPKPITLPSTGGFIVPETTTTTTTAADTTSAPQAAETTATVADTTTTTAATTTTTAAPEATTAAPAPDTSTTEQPVPTEGTSDSGSANVGNDGAANGKGENPDTGAAIAIVPMIVAAAAVSFIAYKRKK